MPQDPMYRLKRWMDPRPFRTAICSMGGVGSTMLARHLLSLADKTHREHGWSPVVYEKEKNLRLGYMFGNPHNAVLSVFRRSFQDMHVRAMNATSPTDGLKLNGMSIEAYLERGIDDFHIERQFDNWTNPVNAKHPTILIKYETLGDNIGEVLKFFACDKPFEVLPRKSSWKSEPEHIQRGLENMYGALLTKIDAMPGLLILPGTASAISKSPVSAAG